MGISWSAYPQRLKQGVLYYLKGLYRQFADKAIFLFAQAIAFKVLITIVPVIILATGILGRFLQQERPFEIVSSFIIDFLPPYRSQSIIAFLQQFADASGTFTLVGAGGLLFSVVILFTTLRLTIGGVFQEEWHTSRTILGGYLFDIRMAAQVGLLFLLTFGLTLVMQYLSTAGIEQLSAWGLDYVWVRDGWRRTFRLLGLLIPFLVTVTMFFQMFFFIPKPHPPRRSAFAGALFSAVLWEIAKNIFTVYATRIGRFEYSSTGMEEGGAPIGETFGLIIGFVFWVYYSGVVLLIGAIVALLHEKSHRSRRLVGKKEERKDLDGEAPSPILARSGPAVVDAEVSEVEGTARP